MLRVDGTIASDTPKGTDIAEEVLKGITIKNTSIGPIEKKEFAPVHTEGRPVGYGKVAAPVDMKAGDTFVMEADSRVVLTVTRAGKEIYISTREKRFRIDNQQKAAKLESEVDVEYAAMVKGAK